MAAAGRLYSYLVTCRPCGEPAALTPKTRGRKPAPVDPHDRKITELERQLAAMTAHWRSEPRPCWTPRKLAALLGRPRVSE